MTDQATLAELCKAIGFSFKAGASLDWNKQDEWQQQANSYRCRLTYQGRRYSFDFWQGNGIKDDPTAEGCLECLLSDASGADADFEEWCGDYGYDTDSRKAERLYRACKRVRANVERLLGDDFDTFLYADR